MTTIEQGAQPNGYLPANFAGYNEALWAPIENGVQIAIGCGDDRPVTQASAELINTALSDQLGAMPVEEGFASIYGGRAGLVKNLLVAGSAAHGERFVSSIRGFKGAEAVIGNHFGKLALYHSDETNENNSGRFSPDANCGIGCAYCMLVGATAYYSIDDHGKPAGDRAVIAGIVDTIKSDQEQVFGSEQYVTDLLKGQRLVAQHFASEAGTEDARDFSIGRPEFVEFQSAGKLVMILAGAHKSVRKTGIVVNLDPTTVGSANKAEDVGSQMYRSDIGYITSRMASLLREYRIPAEIFARSILADTAPVRAALVAHDNDPKLQGKLDPKPLGLGIRGNANEMLDYVAYQHSR